jgi:hypothetical protein
MRRVGLMLALTGVLLGALFTSGVTAKQRTKGITVPPVCVRQPLPGGLQLQVGYCPTARPR